MEIFPSTETEVNVEDSVVLLGLKPANSDNSDVFSYN